MEKTKFILLIAVVAFVAIAVANRVSQLRNWLSTDVQPASSGN